MRIKFVLLCLLLLGSACAQTDLVSAHKKEIRPDSNQNKTIVLHSQNEDIRLTSGAGKLVVVDLASADTLATLGAQQQMIGIPDVSSSSLFLKKILPMTNYQNIGTVKKANFIAISQLNPNAIIIAGRVSADSDQFKKIAPTYLFSIDTNRFYDSFKEQSRNLAKIVDKEDVVEEKLVQIDQEIKVLKTKTQGKSALLILVNNGKASAFGTQSRFGLIYDIFGFKPIEDKVKSGRYDMAEMNQYILKNNPDYLFIIDRGAIGSNKVSNIKQIVENEVIQKTDAYKKGHIVYLDPAAWYLSSGGLSTMKEMIQEVSNGIK